MKLFGMLAVINLVACAGSEAPPAATQPEPVSAPSTAEITITRDAVEPQCPDNCCLASAGSIGGAFTITAVERDEDGRAMSIGLESAEAWSAKVPGKFNLDLRSAWSPSSTSGARRAAALLSGLTKGDSVGLLFEVDPSLPSNATILEQFIFRRVEHGGFSNGFLFTREPVTLDEVGAIFGQSYDELASGVECRITAKEDLLDPESGPSGESRNLPPLEPMPLDPAFADPE